MPSFFDGESHISDKFGRGFFMDVPAKAIHLALAWSGCCWDHKLQAKKQLWVRRFVDQLDQHSDTSLAQQWLIVTKKLRSWNHAWNTGLLAISTSRLSYGILFSLFFCCMCRSTIPRQAIHQFDGPNSLGSFNMRHYNSVEEISTILGCSHEYPSTS